MATPAAPPDYRQSLANALGDRDPLAALQAAPARLRAAVSGLTDAQMGAPEAPGKWSIKQVLAHLADGEVIAGSRVRFIAGHDRPPIPGYDQDLLAARLGAENASAEDLLESFEKMRAVNLALRRRLPAGALQRIGIHAERGEESIDTIYTMMAGHDLVHERQIERIRLRLSGATG